MANSAVPRPLRDGRLKSLLFRSTAVTDAVRIAKAAGRRLSMRVHDEDFNALRLFDLERKLALDIGANTGQSAVSMFAIEPTLQVVSIEPNPACEKPLRVVAAMCGRRMSVLPMGAGAEPGTLTFHIPVRNGRQLLEEGTFDPKVLRDPFTIARIGQEGRDHTIEERKLTIITIDSLNVSPSFAKIDVQGLEQQVLAGMAATIERSRPIIMLERGPNQTQCDLFLGARGYSPKYWNGSALVDTPSDSSFNVFYLP